MCSTPFLEENKQIKEDRGEFWNSEKGDTE